VLACWLSDERDVAREQRTRLTCSRKCDAWWIAPHATQAWAHRDVRAYEQRDSGYSGSQAVRETAARGHSRVDPLVSIFLRIRENPAIGVSNLIAAPAPRTRFTFKYRRIYPVHPIRIVYRVLGRAAWTELQNLTLNSPFMGASLTEIAVGQHVNLVRADFRDVDVPLSFYSQITGCFRTAA